MNDLELGWVVGIVEGEGYLGYIQRHYKGKNGPVLYRYGQLRVKSTDEDVIQALASITKVGYVTGPFQPKNPKHKPQWSWSLSKGEDLLGLLYKLEPHLMSRRKGKARELIDFLEKS